MLHNYIQQEIMLDSTKHQLENQHNEIREEEEEDNDGFTCYIEPSSDWTEWRRNLIGYENV